MIWWMLVIRHATWAGLNNMPWISLKTKDIIGADQRYCYRRIVYCTLCRSWFPVCWSLLIVSQITTRLDLGVFSKSVLTKLLLWHSRKPFMMSVLFVAVLALRKGLFTVLLPQTTHSIFKSFFISALKAFIKSLAAYIADQQTRTKWKALFQPLL